MIKSIFLAILGLFLIILVLKIAIGIHWPLLAIMVVAFGVGFINPDKGWIVTIGLVVCIQLFGLGFEKISITTENNKLTHFICTISVLPELFGGFMGRYFKRTL